MERHGWMTDAEFLNAVAFGQLTPGPVTHTVALVGWAAAGLGGALLAAAIAFAPSFLAIMLGGERFGRLRDNADAARVPGRRRPCRGRRDPRRRGAALEALQEWWQARCSPVPRSSCVLGRRPCRALAGGASRLIGPSWAAAPYVSMTTSPLRMELRTRRPTSSPGSSSSTRSIRPATSAPAKSGSRAISRTPGSRSS